jgi:hypothetical protein
MNAPGSGSNGNDRRALLERRAAVVRERIEQRLEVLEHRRDGLVQRVRSVAKASYVIAAVVAVGVVGAALIVRARRRRQQAHLQWLGRPEPRGWFSQSFEKAAVSLGAATLHRLGAWGLDNALRPAQHSSGQRALPPRTAAPRLPRT